MPQLSLSEWSDLAQVGATLIGFVGVVISIWIGIRTLKQVDQDRKLRQRPYLAFEPGGHRLPVAFVSKGSRVPGVNPQYAERLLSALSATGESVVIDHKGVLESGLFGHLKNYGAGPALSTHVRWVAEQMWIGDESFTIDEPKQKEPLYGRALNTMPSLPEHIQPGGQAALSRLPAFVLKDYDKKITRVEGFLEITCSDVFGQQHTVKQAYHFFTGYKEVPPHVHVTFSDIASGGAP